MAPCQETDADPVPPDREHQETDVTDGSNTPPTLRADTTFAVVPTWLILAPVSDRAVRLYALLRRYADANDVAWPSRARLARELVCSPDSIDRAVVELMALGALSREHRYREGGGKTSNAYLLHSLPEGGSRTGAARGGRTRAAREAAPVRHEEREPLNESHLHHARRGRRGTDPTATDW